MKFNPWEILVFIILGLIGFISNDIAGNGISIGFLRPTFFHAFCQSIIAVIVILAVFRFGITVWEYSSERVRWIIRETCVPLVLIILCLIRFKALFAGGFPSTFDHTTHMLRCYLTESSLWSHGTLLPWTSSIGAGIPLNDLYPPGGAILFCLIRLFSFFLLSPDCAYIATVFAAWFILLGSLYISGRLLFGIEAGTLAAGLMAFDVGDMGLMGWGQCFSIGMWPMTLANGLMILAMIMHGLYLKSAVSPLKMAGLSLLVMASIISHIFTLPALILTTIIISGVYILSEEDRQLALRRIARNIIFIGLGLALSGWWLLPIMANQIWMLPFGTPLSPLSWLASRIINARLFENSPPIIMALSFFGIFWGFLSRKMLPRSFSIIACLFLLINNAFWMQCFHSEWFSSLIIKMPLHRYAGLAKLMGYLLAGGMCCELLKKLQPQLSKFWRRIFSGFYSSESISSFQLVTATIWKCLLFACFICFMAPAIVGVTNLLDEKYSFRDSFPIASSESYPPYANNFGRMMRYLNAVDAPSLDENQFLKPISGPRIDVQTNIMESSIPYKYGYGIIAPRYMPTMLLTTRSTRNDVLNSALSGAKYIAALGEGVARNITKKPNTKIIHSFGDIYLFKSTDYQETPVQFVNGVKGMAEIISNEPNYLAIRLSGMNEAGRVRIGVSRFRKWRAFLDGQETPIEEYIGYDESFDAGKYITVKALNGLLELRYQSQLIDIIGLWASFAALFIIVVGLVWNRLFRFLSFESSFLNPVLNRVFSKKSGVIYQSFLGAGITIAFFVIWLWQPVAATNFWFAGITSDCTGIVNQQPDGLLDMEFGLYIGEDLRGKTIQFMSIQEHLPVHIKPSKNKWTTQNSMNSWRIVVQSLVGDMNAKLSPPHHLRIFVWNPHRGEYIPSGTEMELTIKFTDGSNKIYRCPLEAQGNH